MIVELGDYAWSEHSHGIFGLSDYHQERTSPTYSQRKNNPRQLHPHHQKQFNPKCQNIDELRTAILQEWQQFP
jgi:transposase